MGYIIVKVDDSFKNEFKAKVSLAGKTITSVILELINQWLELKSDIADEFERKNYDPDLPGHERDLKEE